MIVTYNEKGWNIVTQRSHGMLAAQLAIQWKIKERPARWMETLLAIAEHDDAEAELDGELLLTPTGGPLDYSMKTFDKAHCIKLAMLTVNKSRYIALLTSMHMEFLYRDDARTDKEAREFLQNQKKIREQLRTDLGIKSTRLEKTYSLLEWCDAFSLLLCQGNIPPEKRSIEISTGRGRKPYLLFQLKTHVLSVDPWPFEDNSFEVYFEYRCLDQLKFRDSAQFRKVFLSSPVKEKSWTIRKKPAHFHKRNKVRTDN